MTSNIAPPLATLKAIKSAVRKRISSTLRSLTQDDVKQQTEQVTATLLRQPFFHQSKNIACYLSMPIGEIDTAPLVSTILRSGKTLFVPRVDPRIIGRMDFLRVYGEDDLTSFPAGLWGIREPGEQYQGRRRQHNSENLDLILVPAVAFDRSFRRLGHGKGYYDRFLTQRSAHCSGSLLPLAVGLSLEEQILEGGEVPANELDWRMDVIVGPSEIMHKAAANS
ncbi:5-formyltetrahydrofolate cyclo-ligase [Cytidiella melzeri]|nr:5-formyltetrahydrofolate cyclo-ligase [Cytidiella melzeri]